MHGGNVWQGEGPLRWLDFSANLRPEGPPEWVREALVNALSEARWYPDPSMARERAALGRFLSLPEDWVLPTAGGASAIALAAGLEATEHLTLTPCFGEYARQAKTLGRPVRTLPMLAGRHIVGDPAEQAEGALSQGCAVWLCNPNNPLGTVFSREQVTRVLEQIETVNGWLILDEAFIEYCPEQTCTPLLAEHGRLVILGSMTKILGVPGVRLGYLCANPHVIEGLARRLTPWALNSFAGAVLRALPEHRGEFARYALENERRRDGLKAALERLGAFVYPSRAPFLLADFGRPVRPIAEALKKRGILVRECMDFDGVDDGAHLRLAVRTESENERLITALREAMACAGNH